MTAAWSRSQTGKRYPYFFCQNRSCDEYRKNIRAEKIDAGFTGILRNLAPGKPMLDIAIAMLKDALGQRAGQIKHIKAALGRDLAKLE